MLIQYPPISDGEGEGRYIWVTLFKKTPTLRNQHWKCVLKGDAEVNTASLGPPVHSLDVNDPAQMKAELAKVITHLNTYNVYSYNIFICF